ncbi:DUF58 domain-containing protein [Vibrio ezurae]|uniref:DUF58 domain-containing protein n=1 Tax=Vibrio ezurae NBRC 102218 TaxID=1219080 RepID=U3B2J4_9VIBR|nr:DUF58 domain-containing protein [Vibrio ezurae]GAD80175.1 hypothetical protein VEZ01S_26_00130 [Vibrio ezurae NBRC 102218]
MFERLKTHAFWGGNSHSSNKAEQVLSSAHLPASTNGVTVSIDELSFYQLHGKRWQPPAKSLWSQLNGQHSSSRKGRGMTFSEVRQYQAGDDVRQIDWRVTARTGKVHTKLFTEERERPVILFLDLTPSMFTGTQLLLKSVQMCHLASLLAWIAIANNDRVGAFIRFGSNITEIRPSNSKVALLQLLNKVCDIHNQGLKTPFKNLDSESDASLQIIANRCKKGSELIILSDFSSFSESDTTLITQVSAHNKVRAIQLYDPIEMGDTHAKGVQKLQGKEHIVSVNLSSRKAKNAIKNAFEEQQQLLNGQLNQYGIALSHISSGSPVLQQLLHHSF